MYSPRVVNRVCGQTWQGITLQQGWGPSDSSPRDPDSRQSFFFFFFFFLFFHFIILLTATKVFSGMSIGFFMYVYCVKSYKENGAEIHNKNWGSL